MAVDDPFFAVRGEVNKALTTSRSLYQRWCELLEETGTISKEEFDWTTNELRNSLRSIEWDLEDLEETIGIVEANPRKFKIEASELNERKVFVENTREAIKVMKDHMSSPSALVTAERKNQQVGTDGHQYADRYSRLDRDLIGANSRYIEDQQAQQRLIMEEQDENLELVTGSIRVLKNMSERIGDELDEQAVMLDDFSHEMDNTQSRMDSVLKKMAKVSHMTSDRRQWCAICVLLAVLITVLILLIVL
ncbi:syntaxin-10 isoform X2 [Protopterus annectens]|uniref:syntaxin-10 isoform X2 n=1 Tax=Protopterus annectens TaxID=7888 RepID=UPI001CFB259A|nr:syntaxin-10 isoform X2 [Protopterus annectens]